MRILMFYHTLLSDWNHGNAHFLRGIATELLARGHEVKIFEPKNSWSALNLLKEHGTEPIRKFHEAYPGLKATRYQPAQLDLDEVLEGADLVLVHEWNDHGLVKRIGEHRKRVGGYTLLFHDTHHRMVTEPQSMATYELSNYDGVLAYGKILEELYQASGRVERAWTWHEAADIRVFHPMTDVKRECELVWIGNWGDGERTAELNEFLIEPVKNLKLKTKVFGVRYPEFAQDALREAGISYGGWLPNFYAPRVFAASRVTVHVPRRPYVKALPGIPTIRPFEALACGIPLVCSPWDDAEHLFSPGRDYLVAANGRQMNEHLRSVLNEPGLAESLAAHGLKTILARHTCAHRVNELLKITNELKRNSVAQEPTEALMEIAK